MSALAWFVFALLVIILACGFAMGLIVGNGRYYLMRRQVILLTRKLETGMKRLEPIAGFDPHDSPDYIDPYYGPSPESIIKAEERIAGRQNDDEDFLEMIRRRR